MEDKKETQILREGYQPAPNTIKIMIPDLKKGYQPPQSEVPEGVNPPSGGSNVKPPKQQAPDQKKA